MLGIIIRGGSWLSIPDGLRSAARFRHDPAYRGDLIGFRLILRKIV